MPRRHSPLVFLSLLALASCGEDRSPTAPASPDGLSGDVVAAPAVTRVVNSPADPGDGVCDASQCTLREAIKAPGTTAVTFASGLTGPITLAAPASGGGPLAITGSLTITGPSAGITIRRRATDPGFRILRVGEGATVTLTNLILRNGNTDLQGGGIINLGTLTLVDCTVAGNTSAKTGGGILNRGPLTLTRSTVSDNSAPFGGGIDNVDAPIVATNSLIAHNATGGITNRGGTLELAGTTVRDNVGRGIADDRSTSTLDRVRIAGNSGGGYALHQGTTTIRNSTVAGNSGVDGAGILVSGGGHLTVAKSTIADNAATGRGGGILDLDDPFGRVGTSVSLVNSTLSGNSAETGGGIHVRNRGTVSLGVSSSTVASNSARQGGGGIFEEGDEPGDHSVQLRNTIVAANTAPEGPDLLGGFGASFSLIGDGTGSDVENTNGNQVGNVPPFTGPIDPRLGPLALNGGPTRTRALLAGSPAIDAASSSGCPQRDQRGVVRPQGPACDIGSYERESP